MAEGYILRGRLLRFTGDPFSTTSALQFDADGAVAISGGLVTGAGSADFILKRHPDWPVQHTPHLIAPGFVDCHIHYPQAGIIASWGADLIDWLERFTFPEESRFADEDYARAAAKFGFEQLLRNGVTCAASFCTIHPQSVDAWFAEAARLGLRTVAGKVMMDRNAPVVLQDTAQSGYDDSLALIRKWHGVGRGTYAITPRFAPTSTDAQLAAGGTLWSEHPDCLMQTHLSEQQREIDWVRTLFPDAQDYLGVYERFGLSGPGAVFGHAIHLTERERQALREQGASVAHCPTSNQFLGSGEAPVSDLAHGGVRVGLATDTAGGTSFSMFDTMKAAYEVARRRGDRLTPAQLWWLATVGSARALHLEDRIGNIAPGLEADLIEINCSATPAMAHRTVRAETVEDLLFALTILGDDRAIARVHAAGRVVYERRCDGPGQGENG